jgi:hypothetical protein
MRVIDRILLTIAIVLSATTAASAGDGNRMWPIDGIPVIEEPWGARGGLFGGRTMRVQIRRCSY